VHAFLGTADTNFLSQPGKLIISSEFILLPDSFEKKKVTYETFWLFKIDMNTIRKSPLLK
jgi:hypothetical protein